MRAIIHKFITLLVALRLPNLSLAETSASILLPRAQHTTAGLIKFFFDEVMTDLVPEIVEISDPDPTTDEVTIKAKEAVSFELR
jgi:hypothetical protein